MHKGLILLEYVLGFGPMILLLFIGLSYLPVMLSDSQLWPLLLLNVFGVAGFFYSGKLLWHILEPETVPLPPKINMMLGLSAGVAACLGALSLMIGAVPVYYLLLFLAPIAVTAHFVTMVKFEDQNAG